MQFQPAQGFFKGGENTDSPGTSFPSTKFSHTAVNIPGQNVYTFVASNEGTGQPGCVAKVGTSACIFYTNGLRALSPRMHFFMRVRMPC